MSNKGYMKLSNDPSSSDTFIHDTFHKQETIVRDQDEDLERVGDTLHTIRNMSHRIGEELDEQSEMLDDLGHAMMNTESRLDGVMKKIAKISKLDDVVASDADPSGYVAFCPCMGRFGNQIEQFLGALSFAKQLNRTLILPPFISYPHTKPQAQMTPFGDIFEVSEISKYYRVIKMETFMRELSPIIWPKEKRLAFCWQPRKSIYDEEAPASCNAKEGNPFGPFWDYSGVEFIGDEYHGPIGDGYDLGRSAARQEWHAKYPPNKYPVLSFISAPAPFPIRAEDRPLQRYLKWKPRIMNKAIKFVKENLPRPFVAVHLRNNLDWDNVCKALHEGHKMPQLFASPQDNVCKALHEGHKMPQLFASPQCLGYHNELGMLTPQICDPPSELILQEIEDIVGSIGAKSVFVASDRDHMITDINDKLIRRGIKAFKNDESEDPYIDLAVLTLSDHFIGNCVSTFSSFVSRAREFSSRKDLKATTFFGYEPNQKRKIEL
uniref:GDP-fucose protein O-fucosyltransferase 1 n=1 Tax=Panagrolaimus sp. ES5 TaxID=591445 RepID=A0AC34FVK4_9BILA